MNKKEAGYREGIISIILNTLLFIIKIWAGIISGSIALLADAWHTIADSLSSILVIIGSGLASKKPDKKHPFGHGRWEPITAIFIGFFLAVIAYNFLKESFFRLRAQEAADFGLWAIVVTVISVVAKGSLAWYAFSLHKKTGNLSVKADGWHHQADALTSAIILAGIFISGHFWWIDSILGILVSLVLVYAIYQVIRESVEKLLGERPDPELITRIESLISRAHPNEVLPHHYKIHNYIDHIELTFHIKLNDEMDLLSAHKIATDIETRILSELNITATIHIEPFNHDHKSD